MSYQCGNEGECLGCSDCSPGPVDPQRLARGIEDMLDDLGQARALDDRPAMTQLIECLVAMDEYPFETVPGNPYSIERMVDCYGARWHRWTGVLECPACGADWRDHERGPPFQRSVDVQRRDGATMTRCPECKHEVMR